MFSIDDWFSIYLSLKIAFFATLFNLPIAAIVAYILARFTFPGKSLLDLAINLPLVLPPVVTGFTLLLLFSKNGPLGRWLWLGGISLAFRWTGAVLASAIMSFPLLVKPIRLSFEAIDPRIIGSARVLGANPLSIFFKVALPLASPGLLAGAILGFIRALGEFGATIVFVSNIPGETQTIASRIWLSLQNPDGESTAINLSLFTLVIAMIALIGSEFLSRRLLIYVYPNR